MNNLIVQEFVIMVSMGNAVEKPPKAVNLISREFSTIVPWNFDIIKVRYAV